MGDIRKRLGLIFHSLILRIDIGLDVCIKVSIIDRKDGGSLRIQGNGLKVRIGIPTSDTI